jgi:hypothetical protein
MNLGSAMWYHRIVVLLYAWTIGLVLLFTLAPIAMVYGLAGAILRGLNVGRQSDIPLSKPIKNLSKWWWGLHKSAILGKPSSVVLLSPMMA